MRYLNILMVAATTIVLAPCFAFAQGTAGYPAKAVRVIVASAPGGATDIQARMFAQKLGENLKQQFVVENRPGGNYVPGYGFVAKSPPDGYTLLSAAAIFTVIPSMNPDLPDPIRDYTPIALATKAPYLLLVHPALPVKSVKELIALAKSRPGALDMGVGSGASFTHLAALFFASGANIKITIIPYKGTGQTMVDAIAGHIHMFFGNVLSTNSHVKSGKLRALAVSSAGRSSVLPELPALAESGVPGYDVTTWHGWLAPAGMPAAIASKLSAELGKAVKSHDVARRLAEDGGEAVGSTPEQFQQLIAEEVPRWRKIIRDSGMRFE